MGRIRALLVFLGLVLIGSTAVALEPPTRQELERYRRDGTLARRAEAARRFGNHRVAPQLIGQLAKRYGMAVEIERAGTSDHTDYLEPIGTNYILALLISFSDYQGRTSAASIDSQLFGTGVAANAPYDSLHSFYDRSSYGQLDLQGSVLGWYTTTYQRDRVEESSTGRESVIREALEYYDRAGHDFSRYDNDNDGVIDYFVVIYTGPRDEWGGFWWAYMTYWNDSSFTLDGKRLNRYSWQSESRTYPDPFGARTVRTICHETAHSLGLPDYYDYDEAVGVSGGLGGLDLMDGPGGHNAFSKLLLGWITPRSYNEGINALSLSAADLEGDVVLLMHGDQPVDPFAEYFLVENRRRQGNYRDDPGEGLLIWHVDARLAADGSFLYDNSYTEHKLLRLMEADGREQIDAGFGADAGDYYTSGDRFRDDTVPSSDRYDGAPTNLRIGAISEPGNPMTFQAGLGTGCAIFCDAEVPEAVWPGDPLLLDASATTLANCNQPSPTYTWILTGPGSTVMSWTGATIEQLLADHGSHAWSLLSELADASCSRSGVIRVCTGDPCWSWQPEPALPLGRAEHSAVLLGDGRVLVAGGEGTPVLFDPLNSSWTETGPLTGSYAGAHLFPLENGRVLLTGGCALGSPANAELYDPASNSWQLTGQLSRSCIGAAATRLNDGRILVAGGVFWQQDRYQDCMRAELYDPASGEWSSAGRLREGMYRPALTGLDDGRVLLTGYGEIGFFSPLTRSWSWNELSDYPWRGSHLSVRLDDGRVLIAGGFYSETAEIYTPSTGTWSYCDSLANGRVGATATLLPSGRVLVAGGSVGGWGVPPTPVASFASVELFDPATRSWTELAPMAEPRFGHAAVLLEDGTVLVIGGRRNQSDGSLSYLTLDSVERYRPPGPSARPPRRPGRRVAPS